METMSPSHSRVYLREENKSIRVANGLDKPEIPREIRTKWQHLIDLLSRILGVPASLIMQITDTDMQVFLSSVGDENPYEEGASDSLGCGLYCETVIGRGEMLEVSDSFNSSDWKDNPDAKFGMASYLGFPLRWPDGTVFGTICSLDSKKRSYDALFKELMDTFRGVIETDLRRELEVHDLREENAALGISLKEIHHRIKNHFFMVAGYIQMKREMSPESQEQLFRDIENRIQAIALIHENLYSRETFVPDIRSYVDALFRAVVGDLAGTSIDVELDVDDIPMEKRLPSLGAVLVELITNSMKYAFGGIASPRIGISIKRDGDLIRFRYADNGIGFDGVETEGLGMMIVRNFAANLRGDLKISGVGGCTAEIAIPRAAIEDPENIPS